MADTNLDFKVRVQSQLDKLQTQLAGVGTKAKTAATGFKSGMSTISGAMSSTTAKVASGMAALGIASWLKGSVDVARQSEAGMAKLANTVKTSGADWKTWEGSLKDSLASASAMSGYSKGELRNALIGLTTTTNNVGASQQMLGTVMDLARRKNMNMEQAAMLVGKAYNGQTGALKKLGIELPKGAKGMEAVDAIQKRVAGSAKAYGDSSAGAQDKFNNSLKGLQSTVGTSLLPYITKFTTALTGIIQKFSALPKPVQDFIIAVGGITAGLLIIAPYISTLMGVVKAMQLAKIATGLWTAAQWLWNAAMTANPIGLVIIAVVALIAVGVLLWKNWDKVKGFLLGCWDAIKNTALTVWNGLTDFFKKWGLAIVLLLTAPWLLIAIVIYKNWDKIKAFLAKAWEAIKNTAVNVWNGLVDFFKKWGATMLVVLSGPIGWLAVLIIKNWDKIKDATHNIWNGIVAAVHNKLSSFLSIGKSIVDGIRNGIKNGWASFKSWFISLIASPIQWAKDILHINSPSKVFAGIGSSIGEGLALGISSSTGLVNSAMTSLTPTNLAVNAYSRPSYGVTDAATGRTRMSIAADGTRVFNLNLGGVSIANEMDVDRVIETITRKMQAELNAGGY